MNKMISYQLVFSNCERKEEQADELFSRSVVLTFMDDVWETGLVSSLYIY